MQFDFRAVRLGFIVVSATLLHVSPAMAQSSDDPALNILASDLGSYSRYYAPYAVQSAAAYLSFKGFPVDRQTGIAKIGIDSEGYGEDAKYAIQNTIGDSVPAREVLREWQYQFGNDGEPLTCIDDRDSACKAALAKKGWEFGSGPRYHVWARKSFPQAGRVACREVSIAFQGTVGFDRWDWTSNASRFGTPYDDYYHQLHRNINAIVNKIRGLDCYQPSTRIVSTGHSLGGGLAQFVALANKRIRKVFAFDPSPVTGAHLIDAKTLRANVQGLTIDRIAQYGEVLSLPRRLVEEYPPNRFPCNPVVRTVNVDAVRGSAVDLHMINPMAARIVGLTHDRGRQVSYGEPDAPANCRATGDEIASAGGPRQFASLGRSHAWNGDQASYPDLQQPSARRPQAKARATLTVARGHTSKRAATVEPYRQVAQFDGARFFVPMSPAQ